VTQFRWLGLMLLLWVTLSGAHQQKEAITRVLFNARTGNIEVMHRFLLHDAEHAVKTFVDHGPDLIDSKPDRQLFANYVHERFSMSDQDGHPLALSPVGHEIEGRFIWVYEEAPIPEAVTALRIRHDALRDIWPDQVNLVNVERAGSLKTASFSNGSRELVIELD
jgi:hypothetical protein